MNELEKSKEVYRSLSLTYREILRDKYKFKCMLNLELSIRLTEILKNEGIL